MRNYKITLILATLKKAGGARIAKTFFRRGPEQEPPRFSLAEGLGARFLDSPQNGGSETNSEDSPQNGGHGQESPRFFSEVEPQLLSEKIRAGAGVGGG